MNHSRPDSRRWYFRSWGKLAVGIIAAALFIPIALARPAGAGRDYLLAYVLPIGIVFVCWALDRLEHWPIWSAGHKALDGLVLMMALARAFGPVIPVSGHALFLTYALATGRSWAVQATALVVLGEVAYLKLWLWEDYTFWPGVAGGAVCAILFRALPRRLSVKHE